jgi:uncharacterized membrane protein
MLAWVSGLGAALFVIPHLWSTVLPGRRDGVKLRLGEGRFKGLYALVTMAGLLLLIAGYVHGRWFGGVYDNLYEPWLPGRHLLMVLALLMFILLGAAGGKGYIKAWVWHPMSIGIALWSFGHLLVNGERPLVWLFGSLLVVAVADLVFSFGRGKRPMHAPQFASDIKAVVAGVVVYAVFLFGFHPYVLQMPVM